MSSLEMESSIASDSMIRVIKRVERLPFTRFTIGIILVGSMAFLVEGMNTAVIGAVLGPIAHHLKMSKGMLGLISSASTITTVVGALFAGPLADKFGRKKIILLSMIWIEAFTILSYFFAQTAFEIVLFRLFTGIGLGLLFPVPLTYMAEFVNPNWRGYATGICNSVLGLGYFATLLLSYYVVPKFGYGAAFLIPGILILSIPMIWIWAPESPRWLQSSGKMAQADVTLKKIETLVERWAGTKLLEPDTGTDSVVHHESVDVDDNSRTNILSSKYLKIGVPLWIMLSMTFVVFYTRLLYMPYILGLHHISLKKSILDAAIMNFCAIPGNLLGGVLMNLLGRRVAIAIYGVLTGVSVWMFATVNSPLGLIVTGCAIFFFDTFAAQKMLINESYPTKLRATGAAGAEFISRTIGGVIWASLVPIIISVVGVNPMFNVIAIASVLLIAGSQLFVRETKNRLIG